MLDKDKIIASIDNIGKKPEPEQVLAKSEDGGLTVENTISSIDVLTQALADSFAVYTKLRNFHWNVEGIHFSYLHSFFSDEYSAMEESIDNIAERIRALGEKPVGTLSAFKAKTTIPEYVYLKYSPDVILPDLKSSYEACATYLRSNLEACDAVTANFIQELIFGLEKSLYKINSLLA